ncbi:MAG: diguanylate cyclase [Anaerolineales bacterium]
MISGILFLNFFIGLLLALRSWRSRAHGGQEYFALLMLLAGFYALIYGIEIISNSFAEKLFWLKVENLSITTLPAFWFLFTFEYTQQARWFLKKYIIVFFIVPCISLLLLLSPLYHLYYSEIHMYFLTGGPLTITGGPWYWVQMTQNYVLLLLGMFVILRSVIRYPGIYREQSLILLTGVLIPWAANLYYIVGEFIFPTVYIPVDFTPIAFTATGILYSIGIFSLKFLDLAPIAREVVFENIPEMVLVLDVEDRVLDINHVGQEWLGVAYKNATGVHVKELISELFTFLESYKVDSSINRMITLSGASPRDLELTVTPLTDTRGQSAGSVILARDVTQKNQIDLLINQRNDLIRLQSTALNAAVNAVVISDLSGTCIWVNPAFSTITGYSLEEAVGKKLSFLKSGVQDEKFYKNLWDTIHAGKTWQGEIVNRHKYGHLYVEEMTIAPVYDDHGEMTHFIAIKQDITDRKRMENDLQNANNRMQIQMKEIISLQDKLREQAIRDPLTDLYNRRILEEVLDREVAHAQRSGKNFCVAMIDVDNFKLLNDRHGHAAGDMVLRSLAKILEYNTRRGDISCRYGGEEFAVLLPNATMEGALKRAQQWRRAFQMLHQSFNGQELQATLSIGIASYPQHGLTGQEVMEAADKALYVSKRKGKNQVSFFAEP